LYYQKQREYFEKEKQKMKTGVQKLFEAAEQVQEITHELVGKEKDMAVANMEAAKVYRSNLFGGEFGCLIFDRSHKKTSV
jgi:hypothetical protein